MPTKPLQQKITKPKQAGSSRSLDRWQREVKICIAIIRNPRNPWWDACQVIDRRLTRLLASLRKAERR